jgi:hypothetical protein
MMADLLKRFARPTVAGAEQTGGEWDAIQAWRRKLTDAVHLCDAQRPQQGIQPERGVIAIRGRELVVSPEELCEYYERLTVWEPQDVADAFLREMQAMRPGWWRTCTAQELAAAFHRVCQRLYEKQISPEMKGLEYHLLEIRGPGEAQLGNLLDSLIENTLPMARLHRLHTLWELPTQRLLIVHDAQNSAFREPAAERCMHVIGGARPQQVICVQSIHRIPVHDLAITSDWASSLEAVKDEGDRP